MNMSRNKSIWIAVTMLILATAAAASGVSCGEAITRLMPCQPFLVGSSDAITVPCCDGATSLDRLVGSDPAEIITLCKCLKHAAAAMGVAPARASQIPQLCHISVPVPINPNVDCDSKNLV